MHHSLYVHECLLKYFPHVSRYSPYQVVLSIHRPSRVISGSRGASEPCPSDQPPGQAEGGSQGHPLRSQPRGGSLGHPLRSQPQGQSVEELPADRTRWDPELSSVAACMSPTGSEASLEGSSSGCGTSVSPHSSDAPGAPPQRGQAGRPRGTASSHSTGVSSAEEDELDDTSDMQHVRPTHSITRSRLQGAVLLTVARSYVGSFLNYVNFIDFFNSQ